MMYWFQKDYASLSWEMSAAGHMISLFLMRLLALQLRRSEDIQCFGIILNESPMLGACVEAVLEA